MPIKPENREREREKRGGMVEEERKQRKYKFFPFFVCFELKMCLDIAHKKICFSALLKWKKYGVSIL